LHQQGKRIFQPDHTGVVPSEVPEAHHDEVMRWDDDRALSAMDASRAL
jgi:hypothetical protein